MGLFRTFVIMNFFYNLIVTIAGIVLKIMALFHQKIKLFVEGRKDVFVELKQEINVNDEVIWVHCASLGEFEQGRPIIEKLKSKYPSKKLLLTFFSPSGFEIRKDYELADLVCYLPLDTKSNAEKFIQLSHPELAIFVKYEFWPNYLNTLYKNKIKTVLVSGIFRENQVFFKQFGTWMRKSLKVFEMFFVQDFRSKELLNNINFQNVVVSGDTRFDRVFEITNQDNSLPFVEKFTNNKKVIVAGSTWKEDEELLVNYINRHSTENEKYMMAPHNMNLKDISGLKNAIHKKTILYSEIDFNKNSQENTSLKNKISLEKLKDYQVLIVDTIGVLTKIYSYATIAYVGGGFTKSGVHNVLEPAAFGVPVIIGPNFHKFNEAKALIKKAGGISIDNYDKLSLHLSTLLQDENYCRNVGNNAKKYVDSNKGATETILNYL